MLVIVVYICIHVCMCVQVYMYYVYEFVCLCIVCAHVYIMLMIVKKPLQFVIAVTLHKCYHVEFQEHLQLGKTFGWFTYFQNRYLFPIAIRYWHPINRNMKKPVSICPRHSW